MDDIYDIAVIGGGVVGCATLFELTNQGYNCVLLEKNPDLVSEASSGNSGMLHTGFDAYENGHEMDCIRFTQEHVFKLLDKLGVPIKTIGATMVAWTDQQKEQLAPIKDKGLRNNVTSIFELSPSEVHQREPNLRGVCKGGLWIPGEAVTDSWLLPVLMANDARKKGAQIHLSTRVEGCTFQNLGAKAWSLQTTRGTVRVRAVINCAGLYGDKVDLLAGFESFKIKPRKGQYLVYAKSARKLINSSILPVPTSRGKGIIVFKSVYDNVVVGPTADDVPERNRAPIDDGVTKRLYDISDNVIPNLTNHSVVCMYTGVRPATGVKDYIIEAHTERNWITAGGIRSTGVSGCLGIAAKVHSLVEKELCIEPTKGRSFIIEKPDIRFLHSGVVKIDGYNHKITHPLSCLGFETFVPRL